MSQYKLVASTTIADPFSVPTQHARVGVKVSLFSTGLTNPITTCCVDNRSDSIGSSSCDMGGGLFSEPSSLTQTFSFADAPDSPFTSPARPKVAPTLFLTPVKSPAGRRLYVGPEFARGGEGAVNWAHVHDDDASVGSVNAVVKRGSVKGEYDMAAKRSRSSGIPLESPNLSSRGYVEPLLSLSSPTQLVLPMARGDLRSYLKLLGDELRRDDISIELKRVVVLDMFQQLLSGLKNFHLDHQVVHCDIKPENILLFNTRTFMLTDFGSVKQKYGSILTGGGTEGYIAPDALQGHPLSDAADVWSLGQVFCEIVTGTRFVAGDIPPCIPGLEDLAVEFVSPMLASTEANRAHVSALLDGIETRFVGMDLIRLRVELTELWTRIHAKHSDRA